MARTIAQIYDALNQSKASMQELHDFVVDNRPGQILDNADTLLSDLNNPSRVAIWRLWLWLIAVGSWTVEKLFDIHKAEVTDIVSAKTPHTLRWYAEESKKFQYGYGLTWNGTFFSYASYQPDARIVTFASATEQGDNLVIKVAKGTTVKAPLASDELTAFKAYWAKWKDAGVKLQIVSLPADNLKIKIEVIVDRMVLNSYNKLLRDTSINPVESAIQDFGSSLEFDAILRLSKLVDAIQAAEGVIDVRLISAFHRPAGGSYSEVSMSVVAASGYFTLDIDNSEITYINSVNVNIMS